MSVVQHLEVESMKKSLVILALAILLVPGIVMAVPTYCTWNGDPSLRYGFNQLTLATPPVVKTTGYNQPGPDFANILPGGTVTQQIGCYDAAASWIPSCALPTDPDSFCVSAISKRGWVISGSPALGTLKILPGAGYLWYQFVSLTAPCAATIGQIDTLIFRMHYWNTMGNVCAPECGDCNDPNLRPGDGKNYYNADTLILTVIASPPPLTILQDSLTLVDQGQTQAYIPFSICNTDACAPNYSYNIKSKGHLGPAINTSGTIAVAGGTCEIVYGVINAGSALVCDLDTLTIIAWGGVPVMYDTCVQIVHVVSPEPVPLFTVPVVTILVLALILAAAVFMRRRAVSRA
jgi:hypothetical protein